MISNKQKKILAFPYSRYDALICDGAVRSGKTSIMTWAFIDWAMREFNGQRFGICGKTVDSCTKNLVIPFISMSLAKERYTLRWRRSDKLLEVRRGFTTNYFEVFGGKDESSQDLIQGRTFAGVLLDEVVLMPQSFVNQALARCSVDGAKLWFSCNPGSPQHWFYLEWIKKHKERNALYLHFEMADNPSLSEKTLERYRSQYSGVFYDRYILGKWVLAEGLVYPMFCKDCIVEPITEPCERYVISMDYGIQNPTAMILWGKQGDTWYALKEFYHSGRETGSQKTDQQYYDELEKLAGDLPIECLIVDPSATSFIALARQNHRFKVRKAVNDVVDGIQKTAACLLNGKIKICACCERSIQEFGLYSWDEKAVEDTPIKENDHCLAGDTVVNTVFGGRKIKDLVGKFGFVWSYNEKWKKKCIRPFFSVKKTRENQPILKITLENGKVVRCTPDHRILTDNGWIEAKYLTQSSKIIDINAVHLVGVSKIEIEPNEDVYNMEVIGTHNFAVNGGVIVHNCMDAIRYFVNTMGIWRQKSDYTPLWN